MANNKMAALALASILLGVSLWSSAYAAPTSSERYFGRIEAPCRGNNCANIRRLSLDLDNCTTIDGVQSTDQCEAGQKLLEAIFGTALRKDLPDFLVYFEQGKNGEYIKHRPVLMWNNRNTPHLYGAPFLYAMVISEGRPDLTARITTVFENKANPLAAIFAATVKVIEAPAVKDPKSEEKALDWSALSGDPTQTAMWMGIARLPLSVETVNRVTILPAKPPEFKVAVEATEKADKKPIDRMETITDVTKDVTTHAKDDKGMQRVEEHVEDRTTTIKQAPDKSEAPPGKDAPPEVTGKVTGEFKRQALPTDLSDKGIASLIGEKAFKADFNAATGHFSNSSANYVGIAGAVGATFNTDGLSVSGGGNGPAANAYAVAKVYLRPWLRPRLHVFSDDSRFGQQYKPSVGLAFGTNVGEGSFDEIMVGVSIGNVLGNAGIIFGVNWVPSEDIVVEPTNTDAAITEKGSRHGRPFLAIEYSL